MSPYNRAAEASVTLGSAICIWLVAAILLATYFPNMNTMPVLLVPLIPAAGAAMIVRGVLRRSN
jgi:hypothetical protein